MTPKEEYDLGLQLIKEKTKGENKERVNCISVSYAGGAMGNETTERMLGLYKEFLSETGFFYLLLIEDNKPEELFKRFGASFEELVQQKYTNELISIFKLSK